jgi:hypothetical protein
MRRALPRLTHPERPDEATVTRTPRPAGVS